VRVQISEFYELPVLSIKELNPPWWLRNGHAQTLYRKFRAPPAIQHRRQRIELIDGDYIDLDWALRPDAHSVANNVTEASAVDRESRGSHSHKLVLILHGLCGCSQSSYVVNLQTLLTQRGIASVAMNFRGCSGEPNRMARSYHSGESDDLRAVLAELRAEFPDADISVVGYSLGANVLLKYLGEQGSAALCSSAVAVSTPFRLAECSRAMLSGASTLYGRYFVNKLSMSLQEKQQSLELRAKADAQSGSTSGLAAKRVIDVRAELDRFQSLNLPSQFRDLWQFDDLVTAPLHGFADADEYYQQCSSAGFISGIRCKTLLLHSGDDPIIPVTALPEEKALPEQVGMCLYNRGGHVGFISSGDKDWLERQIAAYVVEH